MQKKWLVSISLNLFALMRLTLLFAGMINKAECDEWEYKLIHSILKNYDSSIRPSDRHNSTLNVTFGLALTQLIDVDERNMIITTNCWLNQDWIDSNLRWDPKQYNNIKRVHIPSEKLWKPDILLSNNADLWSRVSVISTNAIVQHTGNVTWLSAVIFKSSCSINVRYFPFDEQTCDLIFASWTFDGYFLDINVNSGEGDTTNYIRNGEWHLVKLMATRNLKKYSCCEEPYPEIIYRLVIRRRPLYYLFNMVFPCLLITIVAFLGFYLPPGCTEKISIGVTTLLSITVFLMMVAESMPPTSEQLPLLSIYYAVTIGIVSCSTSMAVITLNINNKGSTGARVPKIIKIIFFNYLAKILRTRLSSDSDFSKYRQLTKTENTKKNIFEENSSNRKAIPHDKATTNNQLKKSTESNGLNQMLKKKEENISNSSGSSSGKNNNKIMLISTPLFNNLDSSYKNDSNAPLILSSNGYKASNQMFISKTTSDLEDNTPIWSQNDESMHMSSILDEFKKKSSTLISDEQIIAQNARMSKYSDHRYCNLEFIVELSKLLDKQFTPLVRNVIKIIERNDRIFEEKENMEFIQNEWSDTSKICDHLMCFIFPIITISTCLFIFLQSPHTLPVSQW